jgi:hypothetical protein
LINCCQIFFIFYIFSILGLFLIDFGRKAIAYSGGVHNLQVRFISFRVAWRRGKGEERNICRRGKNGNGKRSRHVTKKTVEYRLNRGSSKNITGSYSSKEEV